MAGAWMFTIIFLVGLTLCSCDTEPEELDVSLGESPVADFVYEIKGDCNTPVLEVVFENRSKNSDSFEWDFGDGTMSSENNPKKIYGKAGVYKVTLTAQRGDEISKLEKEISIIRNSDGMGQKVSLSYERTNNNNLEVEFSISANGLAYTLHFGDGEVLLSKETKIRHTYNGLGFFEAGVLVENEEGRNCASVSIDLHP